MPPRRLGEGVRVRVAAAAMLIGGLAGCDVGDIRQPPPTPPPSLAVAPAPRLGQPDFERRVRVPVPSGYYRRKVAFSDAQHGYALYSRCADGSCRAVLIGTGDRGATWRALRAPAPSARDHQLFAGPGVVILEIEPEGWYVSRDLGRTYRKSAFGPPPPEFSGVYGRGDDETLGADGRLWRAYVEDGTVHTAVSVDRGQTWRPIPVPAGGGVFGARIELSPDGREAWLVGHYGDGALFPRLWRMLDGSEVWQPVPATGHPLRFGGTVCPLGDGIAAVSGEPGAGLVSLTYRTAGWPVVGPSLWMLADGTLMSAPDGGDLLIGTGTGTRRVWTRTVLLTP